MAQALVGADKSEALNLRVFRPKCVVFARKLTKSVANREATLAMQVMLPILPSFVKEKWGCLF